VQQMMFQDPFILELQLMLLWNSVSASVQASTQQTVSTHMAKLFSANSQNVLLSIFTGY
jgi:hypothetical protein